MGRWVTVVLGELGVARTKVAAGAKNNWEVSLRSVASTSLRGGGDTRCAYFPMDDSTARIA